MWVFPLDEIIYWACRCIHFGGGFWGLKDYVTAVDSTRTFVYILQCTLNLATFLQDILHTQEQNLALQHELIEYKKNTDEQLQYLKVNAIFT